MRIPRTSIAAALALALPAAAQEPPKGAPSPSEIVAAAPSKDWVSIAPADLLVMTLARPARGPGQASRDDTKRQVVIQLMPAPFSQGWIGNIRKLAAAKWWDGLAITRVQDNYVVQWGDPDGEDKAKAKALPVGVYRPTPNGYTVPRLMVGGQTETTLPNGKKARQSWSGFASAINTPSKFSDAYAAGVGFSRGWPVASDAPQPSTSAEARFWPIHCYGMVGVGRNYSPDTGSGAELYTVIGHAPRHLDRNIALVGRVVEGIEHLSSLPRGTGALGFYEKPEQRVPIVSIRLASELPEADSASSSGAVGQQTRPKFEYLSTESDSFAKYADARANRRDPFFILPAGGADICNIPVPVRRVPVAVQ